MYVCMYGIYDKIFEFCSVQEAHQQYNFFGNYTTRVLTHSLLASINAAAHSQVLTLLALLVQKYKY
jgi:hypothetical protein